MLDEVMAAENQLGDARNAMDRVPGDRYEGDDTIQAKYHNVVHLRARPNLCNGNDTQGNITRFNRGAPAPLKESVCVETCAPESPLHGQQRERFKAPMQCVSAKANSKAHLALIFAPCNAERAVRRLHEQDLDLQ